MNSYLVSAPQGSAAPIAHAAVKTQEYDDGAPHDVWLCMNDADPTPVGANLLGAWNTAGEVISEPTADFYTYCRPLGNSPEQIVYDDEDNPVDVIRAGVATNKLLYAYWDTAGLRDRRLAQNGNYYPDDNPPFRCECRLLENVIYGWYPRWEISMEDGAELSRNPSVRNVRVFSSEDCIFPGEFLYTTGAFIYGDSLWHTEDDGVTPQKVWWTETDQFSQSGEPVYFAIYWSETENGRFTVPNELEPITQLFWETNQQSKGVLRALDIAWERGSGQHPSSKEYLPHGQQVAIHRHLLTLGFDHDELQVCDMFNGGNITAKQAALRLLHCIAAGTVTAP